MVDVWFCVLCGVDLVVCGVGGVRLVMFAVGVRCLLLSFSVVVCYCFC